jgi:hypothetical protein
MKTVILACKRQLLYVFFLFFSSLCLFAQTGNREVVAVVPFWGVDETIQLEFAQEVMDGINRLAGYRSSLIDMTNIPEDVPEGGYEPNVCPSPSLTRGLPYAMTGEVTEDYDSGGFALRVYLWRMEGTRLVYSDRLVAFDKETCRLVLPGLLDWMFSFLKDIENPFVLGGVGSGGGDGGGGVTQVVIFAPEEPSHWLHLGLRAGISMKILAEPGALINPIPGDLPMFTTMNVLNGALTLAWMFPDNALFASPFGLQAEVLFDWDYNWGQGEEKDFNYMTLAFAGVLRTHLYRKGKAAITLLTGGYFALAPFENDRHFTNTVKVGDKRYPNGFGLTAGINGGQKFGPGYLYLEVRWMGDFFSTTYSKDDNLGFKRHLVGLCIGYEFGIIEKKK